MAASLSGVFSLQEFTDAGALMVGGRIYTYTSGTTTQKTAYTDAAGTVPFTYTSDGLGGQFIALNARGELPAPMFLTSGAYDICLKRADGTTVWTRQAVGASDSSATVLATFTAFVAQLLTFVGSSLIGFIQSLTGSQVRTVQDKLRESVSVFDFMTPTQIADVIAGTLLVDVTAAVQAAINATCGQTATTVGQAGGRLFFPAGKYLITSTLYFGYGLCAEGVWAGGYPYVSATTKTSELHFKFGSLTAQWGIDTQTFHSAAGGGGRVLYNEWVNDHIGATDTTGYTATYGLSIKGLLLVDDNNALQTQIPFGALRLVGAPNSRIENVSILGFGYAMAFQCSFGTTVRNVTSSSNYYGAVAYNANNDISFHGCQFDKIITPASLTVPVASVPSWMPSAANMVAVYNLDGSHYQSAKGLVIAAAPSIGSNGAIIDMIAQYWPDSAFLNNAYSNTVLSFYAEQCTAFVFTTAYASFNVVDSHNFSTSAPLPYFTDIGYNSVGKINVGGNNTYLAFWKNAWGSVSSADLTRVSVVNVSGTGGTIPANQRVTMEYEEGPCTLVVTSSAGALGSVTGVSATYSKTRTTVRLEYQFTIASAGSGTGNLIMTGLPYPARTQQIQLVLTNTNKTGQAVTGVGSSTVSIFNNDGTFPGTAGTTYFGVLTYLV